MATTDHSHATEVPRLTRVSMVVAPCRTLASAALWKLRPHQNTTMVVSSSASHCQPGNCRAGTIETAITGTASVNASCTRGRSTSARSSRGSTVVSRAP